MNKRITTSMVHDDEVPATNKAAGRWYGLWEKVCLMPVDGDMWLKADIGNQKDVERARTAMLSYSRRAKEPWTIKTKAPRPNTLYIKRVAK